MKRHQTIVVLANLDEQDPVVLRHAAILAQAAQATNVYVVHIAPSFDLPKTLAEHPPETLVPVDEEIEKQLRDTIAEQQGLFPSDTHIQCVVRQGSVIPELMRLTAQKSADLLCVGRHPAAIEAVLSHSIVRLVRKAPCSVLSIPAGIEPHYRQILVPVDFSDRSREALEVALSIAHCTPGATVTVQHVCSVPSWYQRTGHTYDEYVQIVRQDARWQWDKFSPLVNFHGAPCNVRFDLGQNVARTILKTSDELSADLIVMGSHGRTLAAGLLLGHVADRVCDDGRRPTLCVKRKGEIVNSLRALLQMFEFHSE